MLYNSKCYFRDVEEESLRDNFVIIYELLDEMVDFGYPQTTDGKILQVSRPPFCYFFLPKKKLKTDVEKATN